MPITDDDNHDVNVLPFADIELETDVHFDLPAREKVKYNKFKKKKKPQQQQTNIVTNGEKEKNTFYTLSYIYFENTTEENNFLTFIPYTGPINTMHLNRHLYLPQLVSKPVIDSTVSFQRYIQDYDQIVTSIQPSIESMPLSVYLRFGILYVLRVDVPHGQALPLKEFVVLRNRGKQIKTAFYTCKGVTSPKRLITTLLKENYREISSNTYSYEIQLIGIKNNQYGVLHFQYDEQFQCCSISYRPDFPIKFDFIREKTSSIFRSIDDSYADIFDFRIQLIQSKTLAKTDSEVLEILRGVPINEVLFIDSSTQTLHVAAKLQKFVKYLKCTRSSDYQNSVEQIVIGIGTYEEFQLNRKGQCELLMKASNIMTIGLVDLKEIPPGQKLYDIGMWFSTLCQTCVDLPTEVREKDTKKLCKWFSDIWVFKRKSNQSIQHMNVDQLTTYKTQKSNQSYTSDELAFVRKILREGNLANILDIDEIYEDITKRLKTISVPSANEALKKVRRAYRIVCAEYVE